MCIYFNLGICETNYDKFLLKHISNEEFVGIINETISLFLDELLDKQKKVSSLNSSTTEFAPLRHTSSSLEKIINRLNGLKHQIETDRNIDPNNFSEILRLINNELSLVKSQFYYKYDMLYEQNNEIEKKLHCYEDIYKEHSLYYIKTEDAEFTYDNMSISPSNDINGIYNRKLIAYPGFPRFISSLSDAHLRKAFLNSCIEPDLILTDTLYKMIQCSNCINLSLRNPDHIKEQIRRIGNDGSWLELYSYLKAYESGCSELLLNYTISDNRGQSFEADVVCLYRNNLYVIECKHRTSNLSENDKTHIKEVLEKIKDMEIDHYAIIFSCIEEHKTSIINDVNNIMLEKGVDCKLIFLNNDGPDNIYIELKRWLNE